MNCKTTFLRTSNCWPAGRRGKGKQLSLARLVADTQSTSRSRDTAFDAIRSDAADAATRPALGRGWSPVRSGGTRSARGGVDISRDSRIIPGMGVAGPHGLSGEPGARRGPLIPSPGDLAPPRAACARTGTPAGSASAPFRWARCRPSPSPAPSGSPRAAAHPSAGCPCWTAAVRCTSAAPRCTRSTGSADATRAAAPSPAAAVARSGRSVTDRVKSRVIRMQARIYLQSAFRKKARTCSGAFCKDWQAASRLSRSWASVWLCSRRTRRWTKAPSRSTGLTGGE